MKLTQRKNNLFRWRKVEKEETNILYRLAIKYLNDTKPQPKEDKIEQVINADCFGITTLQRLFNLPYPYAKQLIFKMLNVGAVERLKTGYYKPIDSTFIKNVLISL